MDRLSQADHALQQIDQYGTMIGISRQWYEEAKALLAAYEDTGLTPVEVAELAKARDEGRLVVLPCKLGSTVYQISGRKIYERTVNCIELYSEKDGVLWFGTTMNAGYIRLGKTVFLTRAEAEAALAAQESEQP